MKLALCEALVLLLEFVLIGCGTDRRDNSRPLPLLHEDRQAAPTTGGNKSAVVFVEFVATPQDVVERMLEMAGATKSDVLYDLGCGDGRIVVTAARKYGCKAVGYDLDPLRLEEARSNATRHGVSHLVTIERKDVLKADLQEAGVVTLYLGTEINARLIPQLEKLRPGARIVSHEFALGDIPPDKTVEMISHADGAKHTIYLWTCPLPTRSRGAMNFRDILLPGTGTSFYDAVTAVDASINQSHRSNDASAQTLTGMCEEAVFFSFALPKLQSCAILWATGVYININDTFGQRH